MSNPELLNARIRTLRYEAEGVVSVELVPVSGSSFPAFSAGAHVDLHLPNGLTRSYSLLNSPTESNRYVLGILSDRQSRGGSRYVHENFRCGMTLPVGKPRNNFALDETAESSVLVAGGIGITPILCMYRHLRGEGKIVRLVYCARSRAQAAFLDELAALGGSVDLYFDDEHGGKPFDLVAFLLTQPKHVHAYCCGPSVMLTAFEAACEGAGIVNVHIERFAAETNVIQAPSASYTVELAKSSRALEVPVDKSLLDTLLEAGIDVDYSCREGICGACETRVLEGCPDHRDSVLSTAEKTGNKTMMVCVSGAKCGKLILDL
ncbi:ferredoxin [Burkholderia mayonis]|uniref:Ferredoxin n=1 Tax=Burkholderia mayonis TaxID=1385591 RepID=A0A1B4FG42_9BURK|nr:PDR/VanB family oxidoreductase [Burkholderia mayonis]AOJ02668.1 ferredoxin [Burkholderia mayonis]KVE45785.1 ferredoxin [Burkholderia mayonis]